MVDVDAYGPTCPLRVDHAIMTHHAHRLALHPVEKLAETGLGFIGGIGLHGSHSIVDGITKLV